jgi:peptidoglycan/xylan/chitin deacetylase (PgdA/CDA1 family)
VARAARANLLRVRDELTSGAGLRGIAARAAGLGPDDGPRRYLELGVAAALYHSGAMRAALALLRRVDPEPRLVALAYHTILPAGELRDGDRPVAAARFADQLRVLGRLFEFPAPAAALAALDGPPPRSRPYPCVLTFEDGHENVLRQAWPVVRDAGRACAFFLPSGLVGSDELLWTDEVRELLMTSPLTELRLSRAGDDERHRLGAPAQRAELARRLVARLGRLTPPALATALADLRAAVEAPRLRSTQFTSLVDWREARSAARAGVILGAQVRLHPRLAPLEGTTLRAELRAARDTIARGVETPPALVAFPTVEAGAIDGRAIEAARAAGFTHGFASTGGVARGADERLALPRLEPRDEPGVLTALAIVRVLAADVLRALVGAPANVRPRVAPVRSVRASAVEVEPVSPPVRLAASGLGAAHATLGEP